MIFDLSLADISLGRVGAVVEMESNKTILWTTTLPSIEEPTTPDKATYIARHLGAQHLPLTTIIPISVVYSIIFIVGVLGNVSTICVILRNKYMHTPTNVYLANLALSDLLTHLIGNVSQTQRDHLF